MSFPRTRILAAAALLAGTVALSSTPASAGITSGLATTPSFNRDAPEFTFEADGAEPACDSPAATITGESGELDPDLVLAFDTPLSGTFAPGDAPAGYYELSIECQNGEFPETYSGSFAFARLTVEKVVEGTAPAGTTFAVEADCFSETGDPYDFTEDLEFPAEGGSQAVILYGGAVCTTSETDDGGADSSSVDNPETDFGPAPVDLTSTVTNVFEASPPTPTPEPPAALPVAVAPTFTG